MKKVMKSLRKNCLNYFVLPPIVVGCVEVYHVLDNGQSYIELIFSIFPASYLTIAHVNKVVITCDRGERVPCERQVLNFLVKVINTISVYEYVNK